MLQKIFIKIELNSAISSLLLNKLWLLIAAPVTAYLITINFSVTLQGYYYTFFSIVALQIFVELGLGSVIQQFAGHEWSKLKIDENGNINGDEQALSRLISITNFATKWFVISSLIAFFGLLFGGYFFFSTKSEDGIHWFLPWVGLCITTAISILITPYWSILEGCNQVNKLYSFRLLQSIITTLVAWIVLFLKAGLWLSFLTGVVSLVCAFLFIRFKYFIFFKCLVRKNPQNSIISWKNDMLPMQWRISLSWLSGYLLFSFITPVLFRFQGAETAGRFGMTNSIVTTLGSIAISWLIPKVPEFTILVAQKKYNELDKLLFKILTIISIVFIILSIVTYLIFYFASIIKVPFMTYFISRLLPLNIIIYLLISHFFYIITTPFSYYMRAHKKEPIMFFSIISASFVGAATYFFGKYYSVEQVAIASMIINILAFPFLFMIWFNFRKKEITYS